MKRSPVPALTNETSRLPVLCGLAAFPSVRFPHRKQKQSRQASKPQRGNGDERIETFRKGPHCNTRCDPEPPFQGFQHDSVTDPQGEALGWLELPRWGWGGQDRKSKASDPSPFPSSSSRLCGLAAFSSVRFPHRKQKQSRQASKRQRGER